MPLPDIQLTTSSGETYPLSCYQGYEILVINTASQCGLRDQLTDLEDLYQTYKNHNFVILGFPSNQFKQETISDGDMEAHCQVNFGVTFPLHQTCHVNGSNTHPLFAWLKEQAGGLVTSSIKWNFTKFLIHPDGDQVKRFSPKHDPKSMIEEIEAWLPK